jgi:hypothetical protein
VTISRIVLIGSSHRFFAKVQAAPLFQKLLLGFTVIGIGVACIYGADLGAAGGLVSTYTFSTLIRVNDVNGLALTDCLVRAFRLTSPAAYAFVVYIISHFLSS